MSVGRIKNQLVTNQIRNRNKKTWEITSSSGMTKEYKKGCLFVQSSTTKNKIRNQMISLHSQKLCGKRNKRQDFSFLTQKQINKKMVVVKQRTTGWNSVRTLFCTVMWQCLVSGHKALLQSCFIDNESMMYTCKTEDFFLLIWCVQFSNKPLSQSICMHHCLVTRCASEANPW